MSRPGAFEGWSVARVVGAVLWKVRLAALGRARPGGKEQVLEAWLRMWAFPQSAVDILFVRRKQNHICLLNICFLDGIG